MDCFLPVYKLRCLAGALSFGLVFLWVLSGLYLDNHVEDDWSKDSLQPVGMQRRTERESLASSSRAIIFRRRLLFEGGRERAPKNVAANEGDGRDGLQSVEFGSGETSGEGNGDEAYNPSTALASSFRRP